MRITTPTKRPARIVAGFTSAVGLLFGCTWLLDRALFRIVRREATNMAAGRIHPEPASTPVDTTPPAGCSVMGCGAPVTNSIHGWDLCTDHDPHKAENLPAILSATFAR
jgi:hypothetical protein